MSFERSERSLDFVSETGVSEGEQLYVADEIAIRVHNVSKCYHLYDRPQDRLKQFIAPRLRRLMGKESKSYSREFWALSDVSFDVKKGETVGIIGRNGSGKSTLLQIICSTLTPTRGSITTNGRVAALLELGAGFNPEFTGRENVYMNGALLGLAKEEIDARLDDIAAFADIGQFIEQPVKTYSNGMYVRLAFAIVINVQPQILIIDEALAVGDARFQAKCMKRIKVIQENGGSILFVSHDVSAVRTLCERAIWLERGHVRMAGEVFPVTGHYIEYLFDDGNLSRESGTIEATESSPASTQPDFDHKPVTHWGSQIGCIKHAGIYGQDGTRKDAVHLNEEIEVRIIFTPPSAADRTHLSAAFSIKNLDGTDLIVSATHDRRQRPFDLPANAFRVSCRFRNPLVTGKYLLVAAIEDRSSAAIHYYEYLEGAHYFASVADTRLFGIFHPEISQEIVAV
jgi:lipopolysaccharide transport system ATP-binding protein